MPGRALRLIGGSLYSCGKENERFLLSHIMKLLLAHQGGILRVCLWSGWSQGKDRAQDEEPVFGQAQAETALPRQSSGWQSRFTGPPQTTVVG